MTDHVENSISQTDLILGKYKSQEQLIEGYKSLQSRHDQLAQSKNKYIVPEEYVTSEKYALVDSETINLAKNKSKQFNYTQDQFEKQLDVTLAENEATSKKRKDFEEKHSDDIGVLQSYLKEELGLSESILHHLDDDGISNLKKHREASINTNTSVSSSASNFKVNKEDAHKVFLQMQEARRSGSNEDFTYYLNRYKEIVSQIS